MALELLAYFPTAAQIILTAFTVATWRALIRAKRSDQYSLLYYGLCTAFLWGDALWSTAYAPGATMAWSLAAVGTTGTLALIIRYRVTPGVRL